MILYLLIFILFNLSLDICTNPIHLFIFKLFNLFLIYGFFIKFFIILFNLS